MSSFSNPLLPKDDSILTALSEGLDHPLKAAVELNSTYPHDLQASTTAETPVRVYADGVYDLFHLGHAKQLEQAKKLYPNVHLIVGVASDEDTRKYKGLTVLDQRERAEFVRQCKWVDEVIEGAPWRITEDFLKEHRIDYVAHDSEPYTDRSSLDERDLYFVPKSLNKFKATQRTAGISTTDLIVRVLQHYDEFVKQSIDKGYSPDQLRLDFVRKVVYSTKDRMQKIREKAHETIETVENKSQPLVDDVKQAFEKLTGALVSSAQNFAHAVEHNVPLTKEGEMYIQDNLPPMP